MSLDQNTTSVQTSTRTRSGAVLGRRVVDLDLDPAMPAFTIAAAFAAGFGFRELGVIGGVAGVLVYVVLLAAVYGPTAGPTAGPVSAPMPGQEPSGGGAR